jgi:hypothetical protein
MQCDSELNNTRLFDVTPLILKIGGERLEEGGMFDGSETGLTHFFLRSAN